MENEKEIWAKIINDARLYNGTPHMLTELTEHFMKYYLVVLRQPAVSGTFCEKCNPNGIEDGNVIRCKKCGRGLALIEQNYH